MVQRTKPCGERAGTGSFVFSKHTGEGRAVRQGRARQPRGRGWFWRLAVPFLDSDRAAMGSWDQAWMGSGPWGSLGSCAAGLPRGTGLETRLRSTMSVHGTWPSGSRASVHTTMIEAAERSPEEGVQGAVTVTSLAARLSSRARNRLDFPSFHGRTRLKQRGFGMRVVLGHVSRVP